MKIEFELALPGNLGDTREAVRAYFLGEGYLEAPDDGDFQVFHRQSHWARRLMSKIETLSTRVYVRLGEGRVDSASRERTIALVIYDVSLGFRLPSRVDHLYFELEIECLQAYVESGVRRSAVQKVDFVRGPVQAVVAVNLCVGTLFIAIAGMIAGFPWFATVAIAMVVGLVNLASIVGFADTVIEGMHRTRA